MAVTHENRAGQHVGCNTSPWTDQPSIDVTFRNIDPLRVFRFNESRGIDGPISPQYFCKILLPHSSSAAQSHDFDSRLRITWICSMSASSSASFLLASFFQRSDGRASLRNPKNN